MTVWVLVILVHVGVMGSGNSLALTSVSNFKTKLECETAGRASEKLTAYTTKEIRWVCVEQTR